MNVLILNDCAISGGFGRFCAYPASAILADGAVVCIYRAGSDSHRYDGITIAQSHL